MASLRSALVLATVSAAALVAATSANASSFSLRSGQSAQGLGLSFAGGASGGIGLGSMAWNPAAITLFPGRNSQFNATYILPQAEYDVTDPVTLGTARLLGLPAGTGNIGGNGAFVPASYTNFQVGDLYLGWTTGAPYGLSSKPETQNSLATFYNRSASIRTLNFSPTIGWRVNDMLSLGAAVQFQYIDIGLKRALTPIPTTIASVPSTSLEGDDFALGFRVGAVLTPWEGATFGISYRSTIEHDLSGTLTAGVGPTAGIPIPVSARLQLPDSITVGYSQVLNDRWTVHLGGEWTNWSVFDNIPIRLANGTVQNFLNFEYDDSVYLSAGAEYKWNDRLTLRAGVAYEWSAVSDRVRTVIISDNDRLWLSAGVGYQFTEQLRFDASYAHLFVEEAPVTLTAASNNPSFQQLQYVASAEPSVDIFSVSLTYRWDRPQAASAVPGGVYKP
ncbi:OmpP1/FadL family transporter [Salinarimonas ramus]|uniref:Fatty acid transporter n=1 Tax=Salinarimonas ramus TaxID=690164 RepID=A0A917Q3F2_9HYPH|nr:outer membrane protein transport protein [Salinarimonas ramus]GGK19763.1 fatty acid transporter [Salinarimonas ramus]